eukprot:8177457-Ditylum_brightwellii.AAC.1
MGLSLSSNHVKGHQDKKDIVGKLDWEPQLNIEVDTLANIVSMKIKNKIQKEEFHTLPSCPAYLKIEGSAIT